MTAPWWRSRPARSWPGPHRRLLELLSRLAAQADLKVMVVSGRPLNDLQELLPVPGLDFLGSHGGEAFIGGRLHPLPIAAVDEQELSRWRNRLASRLQPFQGWWIEDKPQGLALHYRQVAPEHTYEFIGILGILQEQLRQEGRWQLLAGKKVHEILPQGVSKGAAIQLILLLSEIFWFFPDIFRRRYHRYKRLSRFTGSGADHPSGRPPEANCSNPLPP